MSRINLICRGVEGLTGEPSQFIDWAQEEKAPLSPHSKPGHLQGYPTAVGEEEGEQGENKRLQKKKKMLWPAARWHPWCRSWCPSVNSNTSSSRPSDSRAPLPAPWPRVLFLWCGTRSVLSPQRLSQLVTSYLDDFWLSTSFSPRVWNGSLVARGTAHVFSPPWSQSAMPGTLTFKQMKAGVSMYLTLEQCEGWGCWPPAQSKICV